MRHHTGESVPMLPISFRRLLTILVLSMLAVGGSQTAYAQSNNTANTVGGIVGLFAGIAQAGAKADAQKKWMQVAEPVRACVNVAYSSKGVTLDQIYNEGIAPSDQRIAPVINFCNATMTRQLRQNFACNVQNSKGQQVTSICSEGFARPVNGSLTAASTEDYITAAMNGEKVQIAAIETGAGRTARERAERAQQEELARKAEAERQAFLNSPEGKRQIAAEAAQAKREEAQKIAEAVRHAKEYPYIAIITCGFSGWQNVGSSICFAGGESKNETHIELHNGREYKFMGFSEVNNIRRTNRGEEIDLRTNFSLEMQNAHESLRLGLRIISRSGQVIYQKQVGQYGTIMFKH